MHPYLHILIRVEDDGSLHALGAFTNKESQKAYQEAIGLLDKQVRLDFYNGPFEETIEVIYAGHRRWNMTRFQLGGYFRTEGEAWTWVTQEGYVSVLRVDSTYEEEKTLEKQALEEYSKLQKSWRLSSYEEIVAREGVDKARANIMLRFYEDALESFKPKTKRDTRAAYVFLIIAFLFPIAIYYMLQQGPKYGENVTSVDWLPDYASDISFYRSDQVSIFEFATEVDDFKLWAENEGFQTFTVNKPISLSRYIAYIPRNKQLDATNRELTDQDFVAWQDLISIRVEHGIYALDDKNLIAVYDYVTKKAYYENLDVIAP
jgi:hypothetical protein